MCAFKCWRLTGAHDTININQRFSPAVISVSCQCVPKMWADIHVINAQHFYDSLIHISQNAHHFFSDLVTGLSKDKTV